MKSDKLHFIFPAHPLKPRVVEEMYADQLDSIQAAGYSASLCPDTVIQQGKPLQNIPAGATVIYRGWMLNPSEYQRLAEAVAAASAIMLTPLDAYLAAHHLPRWYPLIAGYTPETKVFEDFADIEAELHRLRWEAYFIKDFVKSLKTSVGSFITDPSQVGAVVSEMKSYRGEIEGGLCIRKVEPLDPNSEVRYLVVNGKAYAPSERTCPDIVMTVASRIPSPFFSIDTIQHEDGRLRIVEIGDGQVSDLVGWSVEQFAAMWQSATQATG